MGRWYKRNINYKRSREKGRPKWDNVERKYLEKLEKAKNRRKLKVTIELRLKKLVYVKNLKYHYLGY